MNKKELSNALVEKIGLSITDAQRCVNCMVDIIAEEMRQGGRVTILGFGTFSVKQKAKRKGMNPTSFEPIVIPAKKVVNFKPSKYLNFYLDKRRKIKA